MFSLVLLLWFGDVPDPPPVVSDPPPVRSVDRDPAKYDPYGSKSYADFLAIVKGDIRARLVVGIPDPWVGKYQYHYWVPSGFGGLKDGEYECYLLNGSPVMEPVAKEVRLAPTPFVRVAGTTPATTAQFAAGASTLSPAPVPFAGRTLTPVRPGILGGTNCPPSG